MADSTITPTQAFALIRDILAERVDGDCDFNDGLDAAARSVLEQLYESGVEEGQYMAEYSARNKASNPKGRSRVVAYVGKAENIRLRVGSSDHPLRRLIDHGVVAICAWSCADEIDDYERALILHTRPMLNRRFDPPTRLVEYRDPDALATCVDELPSFAGVYAGVMGGGGDLLRQVHSPHNSQLFALAEDIPF